MVDANTATPSLLVPLKQAADKLSDGYPKNDRAACDKFNAFTNQVDNKESDGKLTNEQADQLRQAAQAIMAAPECKM